MNRLARTVALSLLAAGLAGCGNGADDPARSGGLFRKNALPEGGGYTILLCVFPDPTTHAQQAEYYKAQTQRHAGWGDLFVMTEKDHSTLCWGRYPSIEAAQVNLRKAKSYVAPAGVNIYAQAQVVQLPEANVGPEEWRLENAPGVYSVFVAVFYDVPEAHYVGHRKLAVEYCSQLRQRGRQAYYYHSANRSAVTVGSFPETSITTVRREDGRENRLITDPQMQALIDEFKYIAVNGRKERVMVPSAKQRTLRFDPRLWGDDEAEARQAMEYAARGYEVIDQKPYPVRIPRKPTSHAPSPSAHDRAGNP